MQFLIMQQHFDQPFSLLPVHNCGMIVNFIQNNYMNINYSYLTTSYDIIVDHVYVFLVEISYIHFHTLQL